MKVKTIMIPFPELKSVSVDNTLREALQIIEDNQLFSMPVVDGKKFIGVLSKRYVYYIINILSHYEQNTMCLIMNNY